MLIVGKSSDCRENARSENSAAGESQQKDNELKLTSSSALLSAGLLLNVEGWSRRL